MSAPTTAVDFRVTRVLWAATLVECVVLTISGFGLMFLPDAIVPLWPWPLSPFTARALGAVYLAAAVSVAILGWRPWWSPARLVVPMVAVFATIVTVLSVMELARFTNAWSTVGWLVLYVIVAVISVAHVWLYRGLPPAPAATPPTQGLRAVLGLQALVLGGYGLALLAVGSAVTGFWPWPIDDFHARIYSTAFLAPAVGALLLMRAGTPLEDRTLGATQAVSGVLAVLGVLLVDAKVHRIDWGAPGTWLWIALCGAIALVGVALLVPRRAT